MKEVKIKKSTIFLLSFAAGLLFLFSTAKAAEAEGRSVFKGLLTTEKCLKEAVCYLEWLEWYNDPSKLVLFTKKRTLYHLETRGVPKWKFNSGFGKQVVIKGIIEGRKIIVDDLIPLGGTGKISKSCL